MRCKIFTVAGLVAAWWLEAASWSQMCTLSLYSLLCCWWRPAINWSAEVQSYWELARPQLTAGPGSLTGRRLTPRCRPIRSRHSPPPLTPGGAGDTRELPGSGLSSGCCHHASLQPGPPPPPALRTQLGLTKYLAKMEKLMDSLKAGRADWHAVRPVKTK